MRHLPLFGSGAGGNRVPVRNGLVAEWKFDECRNILKYSQQFDNAAWTKTRSTITANTTVAPDGTTTADALVEDNTAGASHFTSQSIYWVENQIYAISIYVKYPASGGRSQVRIAFPSNFENSGPGTFFDIQNGAIVSTQCKITPTITSVGDGWYRCTATSTCFATTTGSMAISLATGGNYSFNGDPVTYPNGVYIWGVQVEAVTNIGKNKVLMNQSDGTEITTTSGFIDDYHATLTSDATEHWQGTRSLKAVTAGTDAYEGVRLTTVSTTPYQTYTYSIYVKGTGDLTLHFTERTVAGASVGVTSQNITLTGDWVRYSLTRTFGATGVGGSLSCLTKSTPAAITLYLDGAQLEKSPSVTDWEVPVYSGALTYIPTLDKQRLIDYSKPRKNLLLPNQANCCEDGSVVGLEANNGATRTAEPTATTPSYQGNYCCKVVTPNAVVGEGIILGYKTNGYCAATPGTTYTASAYFKGSGTIRLRLYELTDADVVIGSPVTTSITLDATWTRYSASLTTSATGRRIYISIETASKQAATFYVDAAQIEEGSAATAWEAPPNIGMLGVGWGAETNDPTWYAHGLSFITDDLILVGGLDGPLNLTQYTFITVVKPTNADSEGIILAKNAASSSGAGRGGYAIYQAATGNGRWSLLQFEADGGGTLRAVQGADGGVLAGTWQFVAGSCDGYNIYILKDKESWSTPTALPSGEAPNITQKPVLGKFAHSSGSFFDGSIAYIVVYNRKLTQTEITKNYTYLKAYLLKNRGIALP